MEIIFMYLAVVLCSGTRSALSKQNGVVGGSGTLFNFNRAISAFILFTIMAFIGGFSFHYPTMLYGFAYGALFFTSCICGVRAMERGPLGLTSSLVAFSLIIPCLYGAIFLKETLKVVDIIGFALIICAIVLMNQKVKIEKVESEEPKRSQYKKGWAIYVILTIISDGISATIKKIHQINYPGQYCEEFMCFGMLIGSIAFLILTCVKMSDIKERGIVRAKKSVAYGLIGGVANGLYNYLILVLSGLEGATTLFPIISVSTIAISEISGKIIFKEKLSKLQLLGVLLAMIAIFLIKI